MLNRPPGTPISPVATLASVLVLADGGNGTILFGRAAILTLPLRLVAVLEVGVVDLRKRRDEVQFQGGC